MTGTTSAARFNCRSRCHCTHWWKRTRAACVVAKRRTSAERGSRYVAGHVRQDPPCASTSAQNTAYSRSEAPSRTRNASNAASPSKRA
jgi:hypothetical protein